MREYTDLKENFGMLLGYFLDLKTYNEIITLAMR